MQQSTAATRAAVLGVGTGALRRSGRWWQPLLGPYFSSLLSLLIAVAIVAFFIGKPDWSPPAEWQMVADFTVTWVLLGYIGLQMGTMVFYGGGTRTQMWIDAFTSVVPLLAIFAVILLHYIDYIQLSRFQAYTVWPTVLTMLLDFVVDLALSIILSRRVVDVGTPGL